MAACVGTWSHLLLCTVETISANLAKRKKHSVFCFVLFLAETGEAQVCVVCDLCRKRRCHHRRLKWKHPGVGKRHVHSFNLSLYQYRVVRWEEFNSSCQHLHKYQNFKTAPSPFLSLIDLMGTAPVCPSVRLSACPLICPLQAVDLYVRSTEPSHPSHPISVTQALIASAMSSKGLMRAASLLCPRWGTAHWCPEGRTAGSSAGTAATSRYKQWRWEKVQQKSEFPSLEISMNRTSSQG